jgi:sodium-dependent dicarboxylate transporter 2/3/5
MKLKLSAISIVAGPVTAALVYAWLPAGFVSANGDEVLLDAGVRSVIALAVWMALWWIGEVVPLAVTALLPITLLPLCGISSFKDAAAPYAHPLIFLFLSGFLISIALQKWGLHRRFAVSLLRRVGTRPDRLVAGFMAATAFLSMWLSNTATTIMMLPIALSVIDDREDSAVFATCLLLAIAYSASIGGMATLIGTPPNLYVASYFSDVLGTEVGFLTWMTIGVPCAALLLPATWFYLTRVHFPEVARTPAKAALPGGAGLEWRGLNTGGRAALIVFAMVVCGWMSRPFVADFVWFGYTPFVHLSDPGIALVGAVLLFCLPVNLAERKFVLDWPDAVDVPWGTLLLLGGGLSLAASISATGADQVIGLWFSRLPIVNPLLLAVALVALVIFLTELTSNMATTATLVPVLAAAGPLLGLDVNVTIILVALAASCAFMLPVATPANASIFGSGRVRAQEMAAAGVIMNLMALVVISGAGHFLIPVMLR